MCCTSQIFASCLNVWHCSNSKLLPRCKSIHLGWQEDLTHQQLGGRKSYTLSGKHIPILGYPPRLRTTPLLGRSGLPKACLSAQSSSWEKLTHLCTKAHWHTDKDLAELRWKLPRFPLRLSQGYILVGLTNQWAGPRFLRNKAAWKETKWPTECCVK